jgi:hypothetical protein
MTVIARGPVLLKDLPPEVIEWLFDTMGCA